MGTKYIIEVEDKPFELLSEDGFTSEKLFRVKGFNSLVFDWNGLNKLTPYTEPDLEQVRKEAYEEGFKDGQYAARNGLVANYAQVQETIQVGDEVEMKCGVRPAIYMQGTKGSDEIYLLFNDGSCGLHSKSEIERKTGRHFPEIATILEKMRGEQDG